MVCVWVFLICSCHQIWLLIRAAKQQSYLFQSNDFKEKKKWNTEKKPKNSQPKPNGIDSNLIWVPFLWEKNLKIWKNKNKALQLNQVIWWSVYFVLCHCLWQKGTYYKQTSTHSYVVTSAHVRSCSNATTTNYYHQHDWHTGTCTVRARDTSNLKIKNCEQSVERPISVQIIKSKTLR